MEKETSKQRYKITIENQEKEKENRVKWKYKLRQRIGREKREAKQKIDKDQRKGGKRNRLK